MDASGRGRPARGPDAPERAIRRGIRERALLAERSRWEPLGLPEALAAAEDVARRFDDAEDRQFGEALCRGFYAAHAALDPAGQERLERRLCGLVLDARLTARLLAIPRQSAAEADMVAAACRLGRPIGLTAALGRWLAAALAGEAGGLAVAGMPVRSAANREGIGRAEGPPISPPLTILGPEGETLVDMRLDLEPCGDDRWALTLEFRDPGGDTAYPSPSSSRWAVTARVGTRELAGTWRTGVGWTAQEPLLADDVRDVTVTIRATPEDRDE